MTDTITAPRESPPDTGQFEHCGQCGAPLDHQQRYCVNCAARRPDASSPATRYLASGGRRSRPVVTPAGQRVSRQPDGPSTRAAAVVFFALLPIAVAVGVLVGRTGSDDSKLLDALKANPRTLASTDTAAAKSAATDTSTAGKVASDFSLEKGYVVKLDLLPVASTDQAAADKAKADAKSKGASDPGIVSPSEFETKPSQGQDDYVLYSGEFKSKGEATSALGKLKKSFPKAAVIEVVKPSTNAAAAPKTKVLAKTPHGTVHQVTGSKPTKQQADAGAQIAQDQANSTGQSYIKSQQNLPDVIVIGGDPGSAPSQDTGSGQP